MALRFCLVVILLAICVALQPTDKTVLAVGGPPAFCGTESAPPLADPRDSGRRKCGPEVKHTYRPKYKGIGFEILDSESKACFVPDQQYKLLDEIVGTIVATASYDRNLKEKSAKIEQARRISKAISDTLKARGFRLFIPTETLGDSLINRNVPGEPERHIFDCDTGSLIFLTVAENLGAPVTLVDITLPSGAGHNYVRWQIDQQTSFDWDVNGQAECLTPSGLPSYEGRAMSRREIFGYALGLRASVWETLEKYDPALVDYRNASKLYPQDPVYSNNFAWMIATKEVANKKGLRKEALAASQHAIAVTRTAGYLDTLACVYALLGDFEEAIRIQTEAVKMPLSKPSFEKRLALFKSVPPKDCTGEK